MERACDVARPASGGHDRIGCAAAEHPGDRRRIRPEPAGVCGQDRGSLHDGLLGPEQRDGQTGDRSDAGVVAPDACNTKQVYFPHPTSCSLWPTAESPRRSRSRSGAGVASWASTSASRAADSPSRGQRRSSATSVPRSQGHQQTTLERALRTPNAASDLADARDQFKSCGSQIPQRSCGGGAKEPPRHEMAYFAIDCVLESEALRTIELRGGNQGVLPCSPCRCQAQR